MRRAFCICSLAHLVLLATAASAEAPEDLLAKAKTVLAQLDGPITLPGLKGPVEVLRDRHGIAHIYARNQEDLFFAQGFVTAQDRLFQMDWWRRVARGETAAVVGRKGLAADRLARLVRYRGDMSAEWATYGPDTQRIAEAFTRGINAWIDHLGDRLPIEFQVLGYRPAKWQPEDCLGRMAGLVMVRNFLSEVDRAELIAAVGVEKARRLSPTDPPRDFAPAPGLDLAGIGLRSLLADYVAATRPAPFRSDGDGSNNWVVDGRHSTSGKPLLANDPHRALTLPSLRYLVHLHAPGWDVIGSGEPALPGVAIGHNEHIAWGVTVVGTDQADLYVEETHPDDPTRYKVGDHWETMTVVHEEIALKNDKPVPVELHFTRHGPVLYEEGSRHRAFALRWVGAEPGGAGYLGSLALDRARNRDDFLAAVKAWKVPSENIVYADVKGIIGWVAAALTPIRTSGDGLLPVPGAEGKYEWEGFLGVEDLPQMFNPASGLIVTANHNIQPAGYSHALSYEWALPYRFERLRARLQEKDEFALEDLRALQHDEMCLPGLRLARLAARLDLPAGAPERPLVELLAKWDGVLSAESQAGAIYSVWLQELLTDFFRPYAPTKERMNFLRGGPGVEVLLKALERPDTFWFGADPVAGRDRLLRTTLVAAARKFDKLFAGDKERRSWGRLHQATFEHPLAYLGPAYAKAFNPDPVERGGDSYTPNNARYDERFRQVHGASYRQLFDLADWDRALVTSVPGQSGQPGSSHYADLLPLWARGEYFPLPFSRTAVERLTQHRLVLTPVGR
jgi:penicillin amidase